MTKVTYQEVVKQIKVYFEVYAIGYSLTLYMFEDGADKPCAMHEVKHWRQIAADLWTMTEDVELVDWCEYKPFVEESYKSDKDFGSLVADNENVYMII